MVEGPWREARRRVQEISDHDRRTGLETVQDHVVPGKPDEVALHLQADHAQVRYAGGET